ncbi:MAG: DUF4810 domain-containing protein [Diaphorobacter sp.]|nr:DUF4810 domain-containing protein [Diaphorobacter sp.]
MSRHTTTRLALSIAAALVMAGCATTSHQPLYGWDGYQPQVYEYLKSSGNADAEQQVAKLEEAQQKIEQRGQALPPGYRAHMGMLYAKAGQDEKSVAALTAEKTTFPESASFMDFLLRTLTGKAPK